MKRIFLFLIIVLIGLVVQAQSSVVNGFQIAHKFNRVNGTIQNGAFVVVKIKREFVTGKDSGMITCKVLYYENRDIAEINPDSNLIVGKQIKINNMLYKLPSEVTFFYGKTIGKLTITEAVIKELLLWNEGIPVGIKASEITKLQ